MKVLIISHNPIVTYQNMGKTMLSLFSAMKKEDMCQLYIYPSVPDVDKCVSYYRVTDKDVLSSFYRFKVNGHKVQPDLSVSQMFENDKDEQLYRNPKNSSALRRVGRDLIWKMAHWYNKSLKQWIDEQAPTHIFVAPGTAKFLYDMALKISKDRNIPIITYVCDDYYFVNPEKAFFARLRQKSLHKKIEKLMTRSKLIITICKSLEEGYSAKFGIPAVTVMTGSNYLIEKEIKSGDNVTTMRYMGNIRCSRYMSLAEIGRALDKINAEEGTNYSLEIYSGEKDQGILSSFDGIKSVKLCGYVGGEAFDKTFKESQMLIHTEAFDADSIDLVKNSVSTKIADSLGSGIPFFAYGPSVVASMRHLIDNDCAMVVSNKEDLENGLKKAFLNREYRLEKTKKGLEVASQYHDTQLVSEKILEIFESIN